MRNKTRNPAERFAAAPKPTRKQAVDAMCWQCMGGTEDHAEGVREEIRHCTATRCPLYTLRPYR